jgi:hypothetical protein
MRALINATYGSDFNKELPRLGLNAIGAAPPPDLTAGTLAGFVLPRYVIVALESVG